MCIKLSEILVRDSVKSKYAENNHQATVSFRTDSRVKEEAKKLFSSMGMDLSTAINVFLRQSVVDQAMPFLITRESRESIEARRQAEAHEGKSFNNTDELMQDLLDA